MEGSTPKLGRQDWLTIGLQTLIESGVEAVKVEPLSKRLNVTRGSFYWHFKNRDELLAAILQEWETQGTESIIQEIETAADDPRAKLLRLFEVAARDDDRLEKAVRIWAANDAKAADAIDRIDRRRLIYLQDLFLQIGYAMTDAKIRARVAYSFRLGWFVMTSADDDPTVGVGKASAVQNRLTAIRLVHKLLTQTDKLSV
jgi:AcrR family transcriptional regulator